jgi:NADH:ubiquinone oxidoreductase subunit F (NADH-binding)
VLPDPPYRRLEDYVAYGGGVGLDAARRLDPGVVVDEVAASGLRGRGGAGFPTGVKWRTVIANTSDAVPTTVVVNAAEGEPGTYKDRAILRANPYAVLEGAAIAAVTVGADEVIVALKADGGPERDRVRVAIAEMRATNMLDGVAVRVVEGPGEYLFGEETALLEVLDGRPPLPRIAPPYRRGVDEVVEGEDDVRSESGLSADVVMAGPGGGTGAPPALVDNVETLANVPAIVAHGADVFRSVGTAGSPGTIVVTVTGDVARPGVAEVPMGTTVREAIDIAAGGPAGPAARGVKAVLNGVSGAPLPGRLLDTPLTYEDMAAAGSGLGTGSLVVVGEATDMTAIAAGVARFLAVESCGQCTPCKDDGLRIADTLERLCRLEGTEDDLDHLADALRTVADGARCNLASQQQAVVGAVLREWGDELAARLAPGAAAIEPALVAEVLALDDGEVRVDVRRRDKQPDWTYGPTWSGARPADRLADHRQVQAGRW